MFDAELARLAALSKGNRDWENECVTEINRVPARADGFPLARAENALTMDEPQTPYVKSLEDSLMIGISDFRDKGVPCACLT